MKQLELFACKEERKEPATVHVFPLVRRKGLVRATAAELLSRDVDAGRRYWNNHASKLRRELHKTGLSRADIKREMDQYALAVRFIVLSSQAQRDTR